MRFVFKILCTVPLKQDIRTMGSAWVEHVKSVYAKGKKNGMSYKQAMQKAKASWAKKKGGKTTAAAPKKKKAAAKKEADDEKVAGPPKRAKKKARKQVVAEQAQEEPQSSKKARSSRASRKTKSIKRRDVAPKGIAGVGAPYKE